MANRAFKLACIFSLILGVATLSLWTWGRYGTTLLSFGSSARFSLGFDQHAVTFTRDRVVSNEEAQAEIDYLHRISQPADPRYAHEPDSVQTSERRDYIMGGRARWTKNHGPIYVAAGDVKLYHELPNSRWFAYSRPLGPWALVAIPYWFLLAVSALLPLYATYHSSRLRFRVIRGECTGCGYSLFGNISGICTECGTPIQRAKALPIANASHD